MEIIAEDGGRPDTVKMKGRSPLGKKRDRPLEGSFSGFHDVEEGVKIMQVPDGRVNLSQFNLVKDIHPVSHPLNEFGVKLYSACSELEEKSMNASSINIMMSPIPSLGNLKQIAKESPEQNLGLASPLRGTESINANASAGVRSSGLLQSSHRKLHGRVV